MFAFLTKFLLLARSPFRTCGSSKPDPREMAGVFDRLRIGHLHGDAHKTGTPRCFPHSLGATSQSPQKIDAIRTPGGPFREAKDSRSKQTRERLDASRETSNVCVSPEKRKGRHEREPI